MPSFHNAKLSWHTGFEPWANSMIEPLGRSGGVSTGVLPKSPQLLLLHALPVSALALKAETLTRYLCFSCCCKSNARGLLLLLGHRLFCRWGG